MHALRDFSLFSLIPLLCSLTDVATFSSGSLSPDSLPDPATIKKITELVLADLGRNAYLECQVDANPVTRDMITWKKRKNMTSDEEADSWNESNATDPRIRTTIEENRSFLIIYNVSREDSGTFDCVASNGIGEPVSGTATLLVKHKPIIDRSPLLSKSAVESGETGRLLCRAEGAPNVSFVWSREGQILRTEETRRSKYLVEETVQLDLTTFLSALVINRVTSSDYGSYKCVARNDMGFESAPINFTRTSRPDPPLSFKVLNVSAGSVTLKWVPGFDGGLPQSFRIRFRRYSSNEPFLYSDVFPSNTTTFTISSLPSETEFVLSIMAYNSFGESEYTSDTVRAVTQKEVGVLSDTEKVLSQVLSGKAGEVPRLIIIFVCVIGSSLLLLNVFLVVCFVKKRRNNKRLEEEQSDQSSTTKGGTIEMYAPGSGSGSYNQAVTETSLSGSDDKSDQDGRSSSGQPDFTTDLPIPPGLLATASHQTYLLDDNFYPSSGRFSADQSLHPHHHNHALHHNNHQHHSHNHHAQIEPDLTIDTYPSLVYSTIQRKQHLLTTVSGAMDGTSFVQQEQPQGQHQLHPSQYLQQIHHVNISPNGSQQPQVQQQQHSPQTIPPMPPLRVTNHLNSYTLPSISEEVFHSGPVGHLV